MSSSLLFTKINSLPEQLQQEVLDFIDFLLMKKSQKKSIQKKKNHQSLEARKELLNICQKILTNPWTI